MVVDLKPACAEDWARLYAWRNDPQARRASLQTEAVPLKEHMAWFEQVRHTGLVYVAHDREMGVAVGQCRLEKLQSKKKWDGRMRCSLGVDRRWRGRGYAEKIVGALLVKAREEGAKFLQAEVRVGNVASLRAFAYYSMVPVSYDEGNGTVVLERGLYDVHE